MGNAKAQGGRGFSGNEGCAPDCACRCHSDDDDPGPVHLPSCRFADVDFVPAGFRARATEVFKGTVYELGLYLRDNAKGPS